MIVVYCYYFSTLKFSIITRTRGISLEKRTDNKSQIIKFIWRY